MPHLKIFALSLWQLCSARRVFAPHWSDIQLGFKYSPPSNVAGSHASTPTLRPEYHF
jgi:hypothetical protein